MGPSISHFKLNAHEHSILASGTRLGFAPSYKPSQRQRPFVGVRRFFVGMHMSIPLGCARWHPFRLQAYKPVSSLRTSSHSGNGPSYVRADFSFEHTQAFRIDCAGRHPFSLLRTPYKSSGRPVDTRLCFVSGPAQVIRTDSDSYSTYAESLSFQVVQRRTL